MKPWNYKWDFENCVKDAQKYKTRSEWIKNSAGAYDAARDNNWIEICCAHMVRYYKPMGFWTKEKCKEDALKYATKNEWQKSSYGYRAAHDNNWVEECSKHMIRLGSKFKRLIYCFEFSDKSVYVGLTYNSYQRMSVHLSNQKSQVYKHIKKTGIIPEFKELTEYMDYNLAALKEGEFLEQYRKNNWFILNIKKSGGLGGDTKIWTKEKCLIEALKYENKRAWFEAPNASYQVALKNEWFEECCRHMKRPPSSKIIWTKEKCFEDALKYKHKHEWESNSPSAVGRARNLGIYKECTAHMKRPIAWNKKF